MTIRPCLTKKLWLSFILSLVVIISGCNGELTEEETSPPTGEPPVTPPPVVTPPPTEELVGTWENKDEDGDGVLDENDDYPFDEEKYSYQMVNELEPNDNPSVATAVNMSPPFKLRGAISEKSDNGDLFSFEAKKGKFYTVRLTYQSKKFKPNVYFSDKAGDVLNFGLFPISDSLDVLIATIEILDDGLHHIGVNDQNFDGDESFKYEISIFEDLDGDGIEDFTEVALDINSKTHDTDDDGISDFEELFLGTISREYLDYDQDNIPNWLDLDSDNDSINDELESSSDIDNDGISNFIDLDSDGNDIPDSDEAKNNENKILDTDYDGVPDFLDIDNDGDGVLDVHDMFLLKPLLEKDETSISKPYTLINDQKLFFFRENEKIILEQDIPISNSQSYLIIKREDLSVINTPIYNERHEFFLKKGEYELFVSDGQFKSNARKIAVNSVDSPIIFSKGGYYLHIEEDFIIDGLGFDSKTTVLAAGLPLPVKYVSNEMIKVGIPTVLNDGEIHVNNENGESNRVSYTVVDDVNIKLDLQEETNKSNLLIETLTGFQYHVSESVNAIKKKNSITPVFLFPLDFPEKTILSGYISNDETTFTLSQKETLLKFIIDFVGLDKVKKTELSKFRNYVFNFEGINDVEPDFYDFLNSNPNGFITLPVELTTKLLAFSKNISDNYAFDTSKAERKARNNYSFDKNTGREVEAKVNSSASIKPSVINYGVDHFDFSMAATNFLDNLLPSDPSCPDNKDISDEQRSRFFYDGCSELQNRTKLYVSTKIIAIDDSGGFNVEDLNEPVKNHVANGWDNDILGPQGGTFLGVEFWSKDQYFNQCPYQNCLYQVITPGVNSPIGPSPFSFSYNTEYDRFNMNARKHLAIRTIIDGVLLKFFDLILTGINYDPKGFDSITITKLIIQYSPSLILETEKLYNKEHITDNDIGSFLKVVALEFYKNEVEVLFDPANAGKLGPITIAVLKSLGVSPQDIAELAAKAALRKWAPFIGQVDAIITGAKVTDILVDQTKTIKDMMFVPVKADFAITWGLKIIDISPSIMSAENINRDLEIIGTGFGINERWYWFDEEPEVILKDTASGLESEATFSNVNLEGTLLSVIVPGEFLENVAGPIDVKVIHRGEEATSPIQIEIGTGLEIIRLIEDSGAPGDTVKIEGIGFSSLRSKNKVTFAGENDERVTASVIRASKQQLLVVVPNGAVSGNVVVSVEGRSSNGLHFELPYVIEITYGDNGNFNDDIFKLVVDNKVISDGDRPKRKVGPKSISLSKGSHIVMLIGIKAEDEIGTYYIQFDGDVVHLGGDELEGRDLLKDEVKTFEVEVGPKSINGHFNINPLLNLQYEIRE